MGEGEGRDWSESVRGEGGGALPYKKYVARTIEMDYVYMYMYVEVYIHML